MRMVRSKVAGVSFRNRDGSDRQRIIRKFCRAGKSLEVRLEPDNRYSEDAIGLWVRGRWLFILPARYQVGYVKEAVASQIREDVIRGSRISVRILEVTGGGGWFRTHYHGVNIEIRLGSDNDVVSERRPAQAEVRGAELKLGAIESPSPSRAPVRSVLSDISTRFLRSSAGILRILFRGVIELVARLSALPSSHRIAAVGLVVCVVGAATWTLGFSLDETVGVFAVLRAIGVVTIIVGLGISSLGIVYSVSESSGGGKH